MVASGHLSNVSATLDGKVLITFEVKEREKALAELEAIKDEPELKIEAKKLRGKRSLDANAYFWQICDKIAKRLHSNKWTIYKLMLSRYGVFCDVKVLPGALEALKTRFRYVEELAVPEVGWIYARCYFGSSTYNSKEMSDLIDGTVDEAKTLGIETLTPDELKAMKAAWKGGKDPDGY